jgi:ribosomal protein L20
MNYAELWIDGIARLGRAECHIKDLIESLEKANLDTNWDRMNAEIAIEHARKFLDEIRTEDAATSATIKELLTTN